MVRTTTTLLIVAACLLAPAAAAAQAVTTGTTTTTATTTTPTTTTTTPSAPLTPAEARLQNQHADRLALTAYAAYLQSLVTNAPAGKLAEATFAQTSGADEGSGCKEALEPIAAVQAGETPADSNTALYDIGEEIGGDATVTEFTATTLAPFTMLTTTLNTLHWAAKTAPTTVKHFVSAQKTLIALTASNLCGDALDVAAESSSATMTPPTGTTTFLTAYDADTTAVNTNLKSFLKLLDSYETATDETLVTKINSLAAKVTKISTKTISFGASQLETDLGLS